MSEYSEGLAGAGFTDVSVTPRTRCRRDALGDRQGHEAGIGAARAAGCGKRLVYVLLSFSS